MSAIIVIVVDYGSSYSGYAQEIAKSIFYLISQDSGIITPSNAPIRIPDSGIEYSYEKYIRMRCDFPPDVKCFNFKIWYDSGLPVGAGYTITVNSTIVSNYSTPVNSPSAKGTRVDFTTKNNEANAITLSDILVNIQDYTSYLVFQLSIDDSATPTEVTGVDFIVSYDEV